MPAMREGLVLSVEDEETSKTPKIDSEAKRAKSKAREKRGQKQDVEQREERQQVAARQPEIKEEDRPKISYKEAKSAIEVIGAIQDAPDEGKAGKGVLVIASSRELGQMRKLVEKYGHLIQEEGFKTHEMSDEEIVTAAHQILIVAKRVEPDEADYKHQTEEAVLKAKIAKVQSPQEEVLTIEKIGRILTVENDDADLFHIPQDEKGPGATAGGFKRVEDLDENDYADPDLKRYIREIHQINARGAESVKAEKFGKLESVIDTAVREGKLNDTDPQVQEVRRALADRVDFYAATTEGGRVSPPAEDLLVVTITTKSIIGRVMSARDGSAEQDAAIRDLKKIIEKAEQITNDVISTNQKNIRVEDDLATIANVLQEVPDKITAFRYVFEVARGVDESLKAYGAADKRQRERLETLLGGKDEVAKFSILRSKAHKGVNLLRRLDNHLATHFEDLTTDEQKTITGDIVREANNYRKAILGGWRDLDPATRSIMSMVGRDETGYREWKATGYFKSLAEAIEVFQLTEPPADWKDVPKQLAALYRFVEDTGVSADDLTPLIQRAQSLIELIPAHTQEGREIREKLHYRIDAFKAWHVMNIALEKADANPEAVIKTFSEYFEGREERTLNDFIERFSEDTRGRKFYITKDENGGAITAEEINLFDIQFELYSTELQDNRIMMNMVEEMTKYGIENAFDPATREKIKRAVGYYGDPSKGLVGLPPEWTSSDRWENTLEKLRVELLEKFRPALTKDAKLNKKSVDEVWGRDDGLDLMTGVIADWHAKKTLHGAFGTVRPEDLPELEAEMRHELTKIGEDSGRIEEFIQELKGKGFLQVRRELLERKLINRLKKQGLTVNRDIFNKTFDLRTADLEEIYDELEEVGYFGSVDHNAFSWSWMMVWGNYDSIRIYSKDNKYSKHNGGELDDDFDRVVQHKSTNIFNDRGIAHVWEFFAENNENRGSPKRGQVNRIWKQYLPGKHHYLFPQNTMMVRWAKDFMTDDQKKMVEERIKVLMDDLDFKNKVHHADYVDWMRSVAIMDMVENGQFTMAQRDANGKLKKFSEVVAKQAVTKFALIDVYTDRTRHLKYIGPDQLQSYLARPSETKFADLHKKETNFYSTRDARGIPFLDFAIPAHLRIAMKEYQRLFDRNNLPVGGGETLVDAFIEGHYIDKEQGVKIKRNHFGFNKITIGGSWGIPKIADIPLGRFFGITPFRRARQYAELVRRTGFEAPLFILIAFLVGFWTGTVEMFKQFPNQLQQAFRQ